MLTRFDTLPDIPASGGKNQDSDDCLDPKGLGRKLSRSGTELFQEALKMFEGINSPSGRSNEPPLQQVVEELTPHWEVCADDEDLPDETAPPSSQMASQSSLVRTNSLVARTESFDSFSQRAEYYPRGSFSQPLDLLPLPEALETAPPPRLPPRDTVGFLYPVDWSKQVHDNTPDDDDDEDDDTESIAPLELSDIVHIRDSATPAPGSPRPGSRIVRRTSTIGSVQGGRLAGSSTLQRGASSSDVGAPESPGSAVRRSRRLEEKGGRFSPYRG
ncbi:hypothetical protein PYCCODRAFT_1472058 [Trametes coccinea BRFM310]|uniref:Uncharacterized protein n=1 Tax=Trametes coccinea (strain BRFM310) TaxID=1353009 RepID=A0A1Y2I7Q3_TRAC3|nr:hypothetical protein PYCCODRAFT_1472058 [Trametes coccinea BRFM310]